MNILIWLLIGAIAGSLANYLFPRPSEGGLLGSIVLGIIGAVVGGFLAGLLGLATYGLLGEIVVATIGALVVLFVISMFRGQTY